LFVGLHLADAKVEMQFQAAVASLESALKAHNNKASNSTCTIRVDVLHNWYEVVQARAMQDFAINIPDSFMEGWMTTKRLRSAIIMG
jgi:hypothetical protein